jgi:hypothetical protein
MPDGKPEETLHRLMPKEPKAEWLRDAGRYPLPQRTHFWLQTLSR